MARKLKIRINTIFGPEHGPEYNYGLSSVNDVATVTKWVEYGQDLIGDEGAKVYLFIRNKISLLYSSHYYILGCNGAVSVCEIGFIRLTRKGTQAGCSVAFSKINRINISGICTVEFREIKKVNPDYQL